MKAIFDTNILIDYLKGIPQAKEEIERYPLAVISIITWMEVLVGVKEPEEEARIKGFLHRFTVVGVDKAIGELAVTVRRKQKIPLPDAIIWATALQQGGLLVTRNVKDFPAREPFIRIPYSL